MGNLRNPGSGPLVQRGVAVLSGGAATVPNVSVEGGAAVIVSRSNSGSGVLAAFANITGGIDITSSVVESVPVFWAVIP